MPFISRALLLVTLHTMAPHADLVQAASEWVNAYEAKVHDDLPYRLMSPLGFDANERYPVIASLHGGGGKGTDNRKQLKQWNQQLAEKQIRKDYPCYVLAPQSTGLWNETHLRMIQAVIAELPAVDKDRLYMMGHSMGGHGSNMLIQLAPKCFTAIAPSAGTGLKRTEAFIDPSKMKDVPIWAFHGDQAASEEERRPQYFPHIQSRRGRETLPHPPSQGSPRQRTPGLLAPWLSG